MFSNKSRKAESTEIKRRKNRDQLYEAAGKGLSEEVGLLLKEGLYGNDNKRVSSKTLFEACKGGNLKVVKLLIEGSASDVNYSDTDSPLAAACKNGHDDVVKYLMQNTQPDVNSKDIFNGTTPLTIACCNGQTSTAFCLLLNASDLETNIPDFEGNTALHYVIWNNKNEGYTQLHKVCDKNSDINEVKKLIIKIQGHLINTQDNENQGHLIKTQDNENQGHLINTQDNAGNTPLHLACRFNRKDIVEILMIEGADETITNNVKLTPEQQVKKQSEGYELLDLLNRNIL